MNIDSLINESINQKVLTIYLFCSKQLLTKPGLSRNIFSESNNALKQKIWRERIEPYIDDDIFKVIIASLTLFFFTSISQIWFQETSLKILFIRNQDRQGCKVLDKLVEDDSYAFYQVHGERHFRCHRYQNCEVVLVPFTEGRFPGGAGWIFPKRSPFLPMLNKYYWELKEAGH